ncbi:hypothetical protein K502DRAFT_350318 [Neoconidiobolus thromboides FSU 785]|nr:hypothetical protein K502DRAFT_350318 [Neoconidiobolus thromboides FSU 785]
MQLYQQKMRFDNFASTFLISLTFIVATLPPNDHGLKPIGDKILNIVEVFLFVQDGQKIADNCQPKRSISQVQSIYEFNSIFDAYGESHLNVLYQNPVRINEFDT